MVEHKIGHWGFGFLVGLLDAFSLTTGGRREGTA
jgi:hypothetical protein